jgi:CheY-like chemotaxis protein
MTEGADGLAVLVVENDRDLRASLVLSLRWIGYTVLTAPDGLVALTRLRVHPAPLVVVLEGWLPRMDGLAVLQALATDGAAAQRHVFLLLTAMREEADPVLAALPADMSVTLMGKPFDPYDVLAFVERAALHLRQQQRAAHGTDGLG